MSATAEHMPDEDRLRALLFGKTVVLAEIVDEPPESYTSGPYGRLTLSDGTVLEVWGNEGGCSCSAGDYPLTELNACDNAITNVEIEAHPTGDDHNDYTEGFFRIFVVAEDRRLLASFDGSDGNGYYGTGWWLRVAS